MNAEALPLGARVRLVAAHDASAAIRLPAGTVGIVERTYRSDLGRRYVISFDSVEAVVFAHEIESANPNGQVAFS